MGRSNKAARQRNARGRLDRRPKGERRTIEAPATRLPPRTPVDQLVMPDGRCTRNPRKPKDMYLTTEKAQKALDQAQVQRARMHSGHVETRFYHCWDRIGTNPDGTAKMVGCKGYHLTSRTEYDPNRRKPA